MPGWRLAASPDVGWLCPHRSPYTRLGITAPILSPTSPQIPAPTGVSWGTEAQRSGVTAQSHAVWGSAGLRLPALESNPGLRNVSVHSRPAPPHCRHQGAAAPWPWPASLCGDLVASRQGAPPLCSVSGPGAEGEVHSLLQSTHSFSKIIIGCVYTLLKNRKSGNTPSFWAGQLPPLLHPCSRPHTLIHVTLGLQEACAFETTGGSPAGCPGWQGPPTSALLTVSIRSS